MSNRYVVVCRNSRIYLFKRRSDGTVTIKFLKLVGKKRLSKNLFDVIIENSRYAVSRYMGTNFNTELGLVDFAEKMIIWKSESSYYIDD